MKCVDLFKIELANDSLVMRTYLNIDLKSNYNSIGIYVLESDYSASVLDLKSFGNAYPISAINDVIKELDNKENWVLSRIDDVETVRYYVTEYLDLIQFIILEVLYD